MFKSYIKIAWRNLQKNKLYSFVNIIGLTVGITSCILIGLYITHELSYDRFHKNAARIMRVTMEGGDGSTVHKVAVTGTKVGPQFQRSFPAVRAFARTIKYEGLVNYGDKKFKEQGILFADSAFFTIFSFPLIKGDPATALNAPNQVVITNSLAKKYFGDEDPLGKTIDVFNTRKYTVTGVTADVPENSQIRFTMVVSFSTMRASRTEEWTSANYVTYLLLAQPENLHALQQQITSFMKTDQTRKDAGLTGADHLTYWLEPLTSVHLHSSLDGLEPNGNIKYIYILAAIAILILTIACVNYTNLATAQSEGRKGEISIRKVLGAGKGQLLRQYLGESFLLTLISLALALVLSIQLLPLFNHIADKSLSAADILRPIPIISLLLLGLVVSILAGAYPALILSNLKLMELLRSGFRLSQSGGGLRRSLIVFQFAIAVFLMISTVFILQQLSFIRNKNLGYDKDQVLVLPIVSGMEKNYDAIKAAIRLDPHILSVGGASGNPTFVQWTDALKANIGGQKKKISIKAIPADENFVKTLGIQILAGSDFNHADLALMDTSNDGANFRYSFILNESAANALGWKPEEAIGKTVNKNYPGTVRAVVKDFHFASLHESIGPLMIFQDAQFLSSLYVKITGKDVGGAIRYLQGVWKERVPDYPFEYHFLDEDYNALYKTETRTGQIFGAFALTAILLACLGLFALAAFTTVQRTKEIGIRKVLGASITSITALLSAEFLRLVAIAALIAFPLSWWAVSRWLHDFAYHIPISAWVFVAAFVLSLLISLLTIGYQAIRAGLANPIESLRSE
jgi:putative ABC transport system permease protein